MWCQRGARWTHTYEWTRAYGEEWATAVTTSAGRLAVTLCAGLDRPETAERVADVDPDLVVVPANRARPERGSPLTEAWVENARRFDAPVAVGNLCRAADGFVFDGPAAVVAPDGVVAATDRPDGLAVADL